MKKILLLAGLLLTLHFAQAADEIQFEENAWAEVLAKAATQKKLVFVDAYTTWCGPCKLMARTVFVDPTVAEFFNSHFINAKIDMEHGEGPDLAKKYQVNAYPTLLFVDADGALVHAAVGARSAADLLSLANDVLNGNFNSLPKMQQRFEAGDHDRKFLKEYILTLAEANQDFQAPIGIYKEGMKGEALLEDDNWEVFKAIFRRSDTEYAKYFMAHRPAFEAKFGKKAVDQKALDFYNSRIYEATQSEDKDLAYKSVRQELSGSGIERADSIVLFLDALWASMQEDWQNYPKAAKKYAKVVSAQDAGTYNDIAWTLYEHADGKSQLRFALECAEKSVAVAPEYANLDTKAMVLMKLGQTDEAIQVAQMAIARAKESGEDYEATQKALDAMTK